MPAAHRADTDPQEPETVSGPKPRYYLSPRVWFLPLLALLLLGAVGIALYIGGLGNPAGNLHQFPIALVNSDKGASGPDGTPQNFGQTITDQMQQGTSDTDEVDLRVLSWEDAQEQMGKGQVHTAVVIPESFTADAQALVSGALTPGDISRPSITVYSTPLAGPLASRLGTAVINPAVEQANTSLGQQLTAAAQDAQAQAQAQFQRQISQLGAALPAQVEQQLEPAVDGTSAEVLRSPIEIISTSYQDPPEGSALGEGAFFYSVMLMVVGLSGTAAIHFLVDSRLGVAPVEMGPRFVLGPRLQPARWTAALVKWGIVVVGALPTAGIMMWVANAVGMPIPHGGLFFFTSWLSIVTVSAVMMALITLMGSAGMLVALVYVVFMGLPSATGVVPLEALPGFFRAIAPIEPLFHMTMANRAVLYFNADADAGVQSGILGLLVITAVAVVVAVIAAVLYDRRLGRRDAALSLAGQVAAGR